MIKAETRKSGDLLKAIATDAEIGEAYSIKEQKNGLWNYFHSFILLFIQRRKKMKKKTIQNNRFIAFILTLSICFGLLGGFLPSQVYAGAYAPELSNAITTYYDGSQNKTLDDWEEFAAVYAYLENQPGNDYATGVDISDYVLPSVGRHGRCACG